ncbi:hypothetical protein EK904_013739, partial [Melospiza melodia maxima]
MWDLLQKLQFIMTYIAPWQIAWGLCYAFFSNSGRFSLFYTTQSISGQCHLHRIVRTTSQVLGKKLQ